MTDSRWFIVDARDGMLTRAASRPDVSYENDSEGWLRFLPELGETRARRVARAYRADRCARENT